MSRSDRPKVLFLPKWYPNQLDAFDGNFIENHAIAISSFADIAIIFVHSLELEQGEMYRTEESSPHGFPEIRVYFKKPGFKFFHFEKAIALYRYWKSQLKAYRLLKARHWQPDLVHVHVLTRPALLAFYLKKTKNIPYIISEHWSGYFKESGAYKGLLKKTATTLFTRHADLITTVSVYLKKAMQSHGLMGKYKIIPNVVATDVFIPATANKAPTIKSLVHVSTLDIVPKNILEILEVIAEIRIKRNDFEFHIYGDGPNRAVVENKIEQLGIGNMVKMHGNVPQNKVAEGIAGSDALILFSLYENQPCVMIEAWSAGVPVIAPSIGGIPEHLDPTKGILIERKSKIELGKAINQVLDGDRNFEQEVLRDYAISNFSEEVVGKSFYESYLEVMANIKLPIGVKNAKI